MICDFCSSPDVVSVYGANDFILDSFEVDGVLPASRGDWCACAECAAIVATRDWNALARRAAVCYLEAHPDLPITVLTELHDVLFVLYAGMLSGKLNGHYQSDGKEAN